MKPLPGGDYTICDYKPFTSVPDNYHLEYDGHYYSVFYNYRGKPAILKATTKEIRICDQYNRLICTHKRAYTEFPRYITEDAHMARGKMDINTRIGRQEKKILKLTDELNEAKETYEILLKEKKEEDQKRLYEAFEKSKRSYDEVIDFLKGKADI